MLVRFEYPRTTSRLFDEFLAAENNPRSCHCPSLDITEEENDYQIFVELPGVKKEDIKLSVEDDILNISGERKAYEIPENAKILLNEMRVQNFSRSIRLPREVDLTSISAELSNGLLRITLKKSEVAKPKSIEIK
ncbi:MAG: Hsp20/alpha crystallin family protein [bacterium]